MERYSNIVDALYDAMKSEILMKAVVKYRDGRTGTVSTILKTKDVVTELVR